MLWLLLGVIVLSVLNIVIFKKYERLAKDLEKSGLDKFNAQERMLKDIKLSLGVIVEQINGKNKKWWA